MELTALCERGGGWWAVRVPEIDGLYTQARRLDQVEFTRDSCGVHAEGCAESETLMEFAGSRMEAPAAV